MRISSAILLLLPLAACGRHPARQEFSAAGDDGIACAHGGGPLERACTVEQARGETGLILTLRHADGGFRRLLVTRDGRGVVAADGAVPATVVVSGSGSIDVSIGDDRYQLPATIKGAHAAS